MMRALLKKQLLEVNKFYFQNRKTGERRSRGGAAGMIVLYCVLFVLLGAVFYSMAAAFAAALVPIGLGWMYMAFMGVIASFLGAVGSAFNTYAGLYRSKDNDLLLSMPIKPMQILAARMAGVYSTGLLYEAILFIPAIIAFIKFAAPNALGVINCILLLFVIGLFVLTVSCALGWIVALIAGKLKNKSFITVIISLILCGGYYYICGNAYSLIESILLNAEQISEGIMSAAYPLYLLGRAAEGDALSMLLFTAMVLALLAIACLILSKTFIRIATGSTADTDTRRKEQKIRAAGMERALFIKEWKRFSSNATYMLNSALGSVFMIAAGIMALVFAPTLRALPAQIGMPEDVLSIAAMFAVCLLSGMNFITAPSISLEGKNIWMLQSLPVRPVKIFNAKQYLHWAVTMPPAVIMAVCISAAIGADVLTGFAMAVLAAAYVMFFSAIGLVLNLKKPNLTWTNETVPVKQSMSVAVCMLGGWLLSAVIAVLGYMAVQVMEVYQYMIIVLVLFAIISRLLYRWLSRRGAEIFSEL